MPIEELVSRLFALRNAAHLAHWATPNFSQHMALGEFYDSMIEKLDEIVEVYQGRNSLITAIQVMNFDGADIIERIRSESDWLSANRDDLSAGDAVIANQIDELGAIFSRALYKLRFLS